MLQQHIDSAACSLYAVLLIGVGRRRASASPPALLSGSTWSWSSFGSSSAQTKYTAIIDLQSYLFAMLGLICANGWVQYHEYAFLVRVSSGGISALKGKTHSEALKLALCSINHKSTKQQLDLSKPNFVFELTMPFLRKHLDPFTYWRGGGRGGFSKSWCVLLCNCRCVWQDCGCSWGQSMSACDVDEFVVNPASDLFSQMFFNLYGRF